MEYTVEDWAAIGIVNAEFMAYTLMWNLLTFEIVKGWFPFWFTIQ